MDRFTEYQSGELKHCCGGQWVSLQGQQLLCHIRLDISAVSSATLPCHFVKPQHSRRQCWRQKRETLPLQALHHCLKKYPINPQMVMFTLFKGRIVYECSMFHISTELTVWEKHFLCWSGHILHKWWSSSLSSNVYPYTYSLITSKRVLLSPSSVFSPGW